MSRGVYTSILVVTMAYTIYWSQCLSHGVETWPQNSSQQNILVLSHPFMGIGSQDESCLPSVTQIHYSLYEGSFSYDALGRWFKASCISFQLVSVAPSNYMHHEFSHVESSLVLR